MMLRPLLAASAVLLIALPARAERPHDAATLEYLPSPATVALCPAADFLALEVHIRLRHALFQPSAPNHLTVNVDRANGRFRSIGEMRDDDGNVLFARTYSEIDCTAALVSMAIGVSIQFTRPPEDPEPSPPEPPSPAPSRPAPPPLPIPELVAPPTLPSTSLSLPEQRRYQAGIASVFSMGAAPSVVGGVGGFIGVRWPNVSLALEGRALFAPSATIAQAQVRDGYRFDFAALSGTGCYHFVPWAFVCARAEVGVLSFAKPGVNFSFNPMSVLGFGVRFGSDWAVTPWLAIRTYFEMLGEPNALPLGTTTGNHTFWRQPMVYGSAGLGPVFTFSSI